MKLGYIVLLVLVVIIVFVLILCSNKDKEENATFTAKLGVSEAKELDLNDFSPMEMEPIRPTMNPNLKYNIPVSEYTQGVIMGNPSSEVNEKYKDQLDKVIKDPNLVTKARKVIHRGAIPQPPINTYGGRLFTREDITATRTKDATPYSKLPAYVNLPIDYNVVGRKYLEYIKSEDVMNGETVEFKTISQV